MWEKCFEFGKGWKLLERLGSFPRLGRQAAEPLKEAKTRSPSLKGPDIQQRPDGARLAAEVDGQGRRVNSATEAESRS